MDLEAARKTLEKGSAFSAKRVAFLAVAGLVLVAGIGWRASQYLGDTPVEEQAPAAVEAEPATAAPLGVETAEPVSEEPPAQQEAASEPSEPAEQPGEQASDAAEQPVPASDAVEQSEPVDPSVILVSKRPVEVLSSPSASAPALYGFPAGRPFRVTNREGGFVQIRDLRSGASGWIEEAALAPAKRAPEAAPPSQPKPAAGTSKPAATSTDTKPAAKRSTQATAQSEEAPQPAQPRARPGIFGKDGLFGGIFRGGN